MNFFKKLLFLLVLAGAWSSAKAITQVADPVLSVAQGTSSSTTTVTLTDATSGAAIYYTTNGANPSGTGSQFVSSGGTITVSQSSTLKVQAYLSPNNPSDVITVTFTAYGAISSSSGHTIFLKIDGSTWAWGNNANLQLAIGYSNPATLPSPITKDATQSNFTNVAPIVNVKTSTIPYENGLSIPYEYQYYGATGQNPNLVPNANGLTLLQDSQQGNNPNNYYSQGGKIITPIISLVSGAGQSGAAGSVLPQPLVISVSKPGSGNLTSAPLTFTVPAGQGQLSTSSSGSSPSNSVNVTTGSNGHAQIYVILPSSGNVCTITASAPLTTGSAQFVELVPNFPSGLLAWFNSGTEVLDGNGGVTTWPDSTGNTNNNVTQGPANSRPQSDEPTITTDPESGQQELVFNGSQWLNNGTNYSSLTDVTIFTVASSTAPGSGDQAVVSIGRGSNSNNSAYVYAYDYGNQAFGNGAFLDGGPVNPSPGLTVSSIVYSNSNSTVNIYKDGLLNNPASNSVTVNSATRYFLIIGSLLDYAAFDPWLGNIGEILVFNGVLTTTQRQQVELYLANKYDTYAPGAAWINSYSPAVQTQINQYRWSKQQTDQYVQILNTLPAGGLTAWFKADSSFATNVSTSSGPTTVWHDSSGNVNDVSQPNNNNPPTLSTDPFSGQPAINFANGESLLQSSSPVQAGGDLTVLAAASETKPLSSSALVTLGDGGSPSSRVYGYDSTGVQSFGNGSLPAGLGGPAIYTSYLALSGVTYAQSSGTATFYSQGLANPPTATVSTGTLDTGLIVGSPSNYYNPNNSWNGNIAEILIYNRVLSSTELLQAQLYLVQKYNLPFQQPAPTITPIGATATISTLQNPIVVRYTLDGTTPTAASPLYTGTLTLTQSDPLTCAYFLNATQISPTATTQFYVNDYLYNGQDTGISQAWINQYSASGVNPTALVSGGSGLTYLQAYLWGYNPTVYSTNGDGLSDLENHILGYSATNLDINNYGLTNAQQLALGLDPFSTGVNPPPPPPPPTNNNTPLTITLINPQGAVQQ